jgi:hypothetical protein
MKPAYLSFLITVALAAPLRAECLYFRVSGRLLKCEAVDAKSVHESSAAYQEPGDLPELAGASSQSMIRATCECEYSLKGSDPRCDTDQTVEESSLLDAENAAASCRRGRTLCKDVCPPNLP